MAKARRRACLRQLALAALAPLAARAADAEERVPQLATVGRTVPAVMLTDLQGKPHDVLAIARAHQLTVVNFWATWCAPCVKELPEFDEVWREWQTQASDKALERSHPRVALLAINAMESAEKVRAFAARMKLGFPLLLDAEGEAVGSYVGFSAGLPVTFFIDGRGVLRQKVAAPLTGAALRERVKALTAAR